MNASLSHIYSHENKERSEKKSWRDVLMEERHCDEYSDQRINVEEHSDFTGFNMFDSEIVEQIANN